MNFYTLAQAAAMANVCPRTVSYEIERGNLHPTKIGRALRFSENDLTDWLRNCRNIGRSKG
jgi:excisionase family DNA binding protein